MSCFEDAFDEVIGLEGGYSNHPADPGGETKWGISKTAFPHLDIANLTLEDAKQIYWQRYWNPLILSQLHSCKVATEVFEQAVNMGRGRAVRHAQEAVRLVGKQHISVDGVMGGLTIAQLNTVSLINEEAVLKTLNGLQFEWYRQLTTANPSLKVFFVGWLRRIG